MTLTVTHSTVVVQPNNPADPVSTTAWNASHTITGGSANTLAGFDNSGNFNDVTVGTGLSLSGGTLTASGSAPTINAYSAYGNNTNASATGASVQTFILGAPGYTASGSNFMQFTQTANNYYQISLQNTATNSSASTDYVVTADDGTDSIHYADFGINSSLGGAAPFTAAHAAYLYTVDNELDIGATGASGIVNFYTTGGSTPVKAGYFDASQVLHLTNPLLTAALPTNQTKRQVTFDLDGQGSAITSGGIWYLASVPYAGTITAWNIVADVSGSIVIDVWKANAAVPTVANTITAAALPTLTSAQSAFAGSISGWTTSVAVGDVFAFKINSAATVTKVTLTIQISAT